MTNEHTNLVPDDVLALAVAAGFAAAPDLGTYSSRRAAVNAFTRAAINTALASLDAKELVAMFARIHTSLVRAVEAEGYTLYKHTMTGEYTLEHKDRNIVEEWVAARKAAYERNPGGAAKLYEGSFDLARAEDFTALTCGACFALLRPDHKNGELCPSCHIPVKLES